MANNVDFITSIDREKDFEDLIKLVVAHIYDASAYLIGGPYDGGRDLVYKKQGKEIHEVVQITIQEKALDKKILADAKKTRELADTGGYPENLTLFISQKLSGSRKTKLKKESREEYGINLDIYDATEIEQIISDDAPEILDFLISKIHGYSAESNSIDPKARAFYDYLALGKDAAHLKSSILDAQIISSLFESPKTAEKIGAEMTDLGFQHRITNSRISALLERHKITPLEDGIIGLDSKEAIRIKNILKKDEAARQDLLFTLKEFTISIAGIDLSSETLELIKQVYSASVEIQISEISFDPPRLIQIKDLVKRIESLIVDNGVNAAVAHQAAKDLIELSGKNEYLSNQCSSLLCVNLLKQRKLEKYIGERFFFIYLDSSVFIRYLALHSFKKKSYADKEMRAISSLAESIKSLKHCHVAVTNEHLEETVRHITQAEKISRFANDEIIKRFGESKNVYFNLYLAEKATRNNYNFNKFLDDLIGFEGESGNSGDFEEFRRCVIRFNRIGNIKVEQYDNELEESSVAKRIVSRYDTWTTSKGKHRPHRAIWNDITACYILSDDQRHVDTKGYGHPPMLITWDSTQHRMRDLYREEFPYSEWTIYTPQRAIERLSMVNFDANSLTMKDSVLAILDEDYTKESSLIDTLSGFFGNDQVETDSIVSLISKLSGRLHNEANEISDFEANERSVISEALLIIQNSFRTKFDDVRRLFANPAEETLIIDILAKYSADKITGDELTSAFTVLLDSTTRRGLYEKNAAS